MRPSSRRPRLARGGLLFLLLAAPGIAANQATVAKDVIVVLDTSGSMEGEKMEQAIDG